MGGIEIYNSIANTIKVTKVIDPHGNEVMRVMSLASGNIR
jgi:uncharacterized protein YnzC (UPF0291/DUF896 family)